jgi:putative oxidoreductase
MPAPTSSRLYLPALGGLYESWAPLAEWLLRGGLGIILIVHGLQKFFGILGGGGMTPFIGLLAKFGYPAPDALGYFLATLELIGGFLLVIGFLTRPVAFLLTIFMIFGVHYTASTGGHPFVWFRGGSEYALLIGLVAFYILINGAGPWSVDSKMKKEF